MYWLSPHCADILCYEKAIRLNLPSGEALVIYDDKPNTNPHIVSCIKAQKYMPKSVTHSYLM